MLMDRAFYNELALICFAASFILIVLSLRNK